MKKVGRNDPCPCGSGKKYKKCCELKKSKKSFQAEKMDSSSLIGRVSKGSISSFFQKTINSDFSKKQERTKEMSSETGPQKSEPCKFNERDENSETDQSPDINEKMEEKGEEKS